MSKFLISILRKYSTHKRTSVQSQEMYLGVQQDKLLTEKLEHVKRKDSTVSSFFTEGEEDWPNGSLYSSASSSSLSSFSSVYDPHIESPSEPEVNEDELKAFWEKVRRKRQAKAPSEEAIPESPSSTAV